MLAMPALTVHADEGDETTETSTTPAAPAITIGGNIFGGARKANVEGTSTVTIWNGDVHDVYGGNDIHGNVKLGTNVDIRTNIIGNIYGGGNGSYIYTSESGKDLSFTGSTLSDLNDYRPNAPKASIHIAGRDAAHPVYVKGAVYCGGNSATLRSEISETDPESILTLGSHVVIDTVFLGSNGQNLVHPDTLARYATQSPGLALTVPDNFKQYMQAVSVDIRPRILYDTDYEAYTARIGSFFCGGNVGSMTTDGLIVIDDLRSVVIYDKIVAGCNNANVKVSDDYVYYGGLIGEPSHETDTEGLKVKLDFERGGPLLIPDTLIYDAETHTFALDWHKTDDGLRLTGGNIYGGCYTSGIVNGDIEINIKTNLVPDTLFTASGIDKFEQREDVFCHTLTAFAGGYGDNTRVNGNTRVSVSDEGNILQVFGGGEKGIVAKNTDVSISNGNVDVIYGGGFEGKVEGNTRVRLDGGTVYDAFGGSCNADIGGYAELIIGQNGRPTITDNAYGGNDFGGEILGQGEHSGYGEETILSSTFVEYFQGKVDSLFGGNYGDYEYADYEGRYTKRPTITNSFVKLSTTDINLQDNIGIIFGGSQGCAGDELNDGMQRNSYVLVNAPGLQLTKTNIYGAGSYAGLGQEAGEGSRIDLYHGHFFNIYGGSYSEGYTYHSEINVPEESTMRVNAIFGGGQGTYNNWPCDVAEAVVNYRGPEAVVDSAIYGGNHSFRRTLDGTVNIYTAVKHENGTLSDIYGAGFGGDTWAEYTHVNLHDGARVNNVYGGGREGKVLNRKTLVALKEQLARGGVTLFGDFDEPDIVGIHNTQVNIMSGAEVMQNAYGAGYGSTATVAGESGIKLMGGDVHGDLYGGGFGGHVKYYETTDGTVLSGLDFVPSTFADIIGGRVKNAFGGGQNANVGTTDHDGATHITMGIKASATPESDAFSFYNGQPTVERSLYGGGQKGAVYGTANLTFNNGYVGYKYVTATDPETNAETGSYEECLDLDEGEAAVTANKLIDNGNIFGGGYDEGGTVDSTNVVIWGGVVRGGLYGGGEIAAIGRGSMVVEAGVNRELKEITKPGRTHIEMYDGHVMRDVFGGGRGFSYNLFGVELTGNEFYTNGYVFGQTDVNIHGGEIGTEEGVSEGYGNVFGGGNIGYVYSGNGHADRSKDTGSPDHYYYYDSTGKLTEDCRVIVSPYIRALSLVTIGSTTYAAGDFVPTDMLNLLGKKRVIDASDTPDPRWESLNADLGGVKIWNAVFAGGNVSSNSDKTYANAVTVYGNATAALYDVYHWDFIEVGTEHTGGLYGGGNLSKVEGYRELNITNYGTAYYGLEQQIDLDTYLKLTNRESAYFELQYKLDKTDDGKTVMTFSGKTYALGAIIKQEEYDTFTDEEKEYWVQAGVCSIYAGRLLNTIQRADLCGVYGSRLVLQGALDRVAEVVDYTNYTINRVHELSLNKKVSIAGDTDSEAEHGNYFGIYSVVNYLGNLSSDVRFDDLRQVAKKATDDETDDTEQDELSYYEYKKQNRNSRNRNIGTSKNQIALASGVFLEMTTERSTEQEKIYGYVTGIIELDLINVTADLVGGGYVYARNQHGRPSKVELDNVTLSPFNDDVITYKEYSYDDDDIEDIQSSGNFIHSEKRIVDDCYPNNGVYRDGYVRSPAHYWYIKGEVYIYNQTVSAYTGSATAYQQPVSIPLTITAASHGKLKLLSINQNRYAYYTRDDNGSLVRMGKDGIKVNNQSVAYQLNDVITYWDWQLLSKDEQELFVENTYVNAAACDIDGVTYAAGDYALNEDDLATLRSSDATLAGIFHPSNIISHDKGYALTFDMNSPADWDDYYTLINGTDRKNKKEYNELSATEQANYLEGPTFSPSSPKVYGQRTYYEGDIISGSVYNNYNAINADARNGLENQATVERAFVPICEVSYDYTYTDEDGNVQQRRTTTNADVPIPQSVYNSITNLTANDSPAEKADVFRRAMICTSSLKLGEENYLIYGKVFSVDSINNLKASYAHSLDTLQSITSHVDSAYYCSAQGLYGGKYYSSTNNFSALDSWCSVSDDDRSAFKFNYDALDVLLDNTFTKDVGFYDSEDGTPNNYAVEKPVDYDALYNGETNLTFTTPDGEKKTITKGDIIPRAEFESIPNDKRHYTRVKLVNGTNLIHIATEPFHYGSRPYGVGELIEERIYAAIQETNPEVISKSIKEVTVEYEGEGETRYYCYETYERTGTGDYSTKEGDWLTEAQYDGVTNLQKEFTVQGMEPTGTITLYMSRESDIRDLMKEKVITLIYQYIYYDTEDETSDAIKQENEMHVVNIHLQFKDGAPTIAQLDPPPTILPGQTVQLKAPDVTPGTTPVLTNSWVLFSSYADALSRNGVPYVPEKTPLYWYQNGKYYIAFCTQSFYGGYTYSNPVPVSVANYHDLRDVMADKEHHMYIDHEQVDRNSKIYVNDYTDDGQNGLDLMHDLLNLSYGQQPADGGHANLSSYVQGCENLDIILRTDLDYTGGTWTPLGITASDGQPARCFGGTLHGDGHTVKGLSASLFGNLCGNVYNLGATGSFTSAGLADTGDGYAENCWVSTTARVADGVKPIIGTPTADNDRPLRMVNCYYPQENGYTAHTAVAAGIPVAKPLRSFYNGEVAYDLNGFYLRKRYNLSQTSQSSLIADTTYVYDRYTNGDFIYANGEVPLTLDERHGIDADTRETYYPIWPDDYLYFGQLLSYGYGGRTHDDHPTSVSKTATGRLLTTQANNRVYRAPAYFRNSHKSVAHFNPYAVMAARSTDNSHEAYPGMTAIDFTGYNDTSYKREWSNGEFFAPLLDDDGLSAFLNADLTQNMLVYVPTATTNSKTYGVLNNYLTGEPKYNESTEGYRTVAKTSDTNIHGHIVFKNKEGNYIATNDHKLVDLQAFNAPISYRFTSGKRMWYQREPDIAHFVDLSKGWDGISLPFTANLVTTHQKGELTHFYSAADGTVITEGALGHEYWLRQFDDVTVTGDVATAEFNYPTATGNDRTVSNTFLYDYYYQLSSAARSDDNGDQYQQDYYASKNRVYHGYPLLQQAKPYLIGFPGSTYYEFDLSGSFSASTAASPEPASLERQTITFASAENVTISISDEELANGDAQTYDGMQYTFMPNYLDTTVVTKSYVLAADGSSFSCITEPNAVQPFRPYFLPAKAASTAPRRAAGQIVFSRAQHSSFGIEEHGQQADDTGSLTIDSRRGHIIVTSTLSTTAPVRIVTLSGITVAAFNIQPGETIETPVNGSAVYIVNRHKLFVK